MRMHTMSKIKKISVVEMLTELTRSLAFQVQMIMWEDRKDEPADDRRPVAARNVNR